MPGITQSQREQLKALVSSKTITRVALPIFTVSSSPAEISSYSFVRPMPIMRAASLILTQIGSLG
jgi:hypothetical protein